MAVPEQQPRDRPASTERNVARGVVFGVAALILAVMAVATGQLVFFVVLGIPAFWLARSSARHLKRRYGADNALEDIEDLDGDSKADWIVYLRPFDRDDDWDGAVAFNAYNPATWRKIPITPSNLRTLYLEMSGRNSFAGVLKHVTRDMGKLVAVGEPGNPPILGARNVYVGDDNWQQSVLDFVLGARLIVLTAGVSEGIMWEVQSVLANVPADRLILRVPGLSRRKRRETYETFAASARDHFPNGLPETIDSARFLRFNADWTPANKAGRFDKPEANTTKWVVKRLEQILQ